jgi:hypothetical protein
VTCTLTADMPIMLSCAMTRRLERGEQLVRVRSVPKAMFCEVSERWSEQNHRQTLDRIRQRGGFDAVEVIAVLSALRFDAVGCMEEESAHRVLYAMIALHRRGMRIAEQAAHT